MLRCFLSILIPYFGVYFGVSAWGVLMGTKKDKGITDKCYPPSISVNLSTV